MVSTLEHIAHHLCWFSCSCLVSFAFLFCLFVPTFNFGPLAPIAYPIAKILDYVLGAGRHQTYKKAELKSFLQFHRTGEEPLRDEELVILNGVLELNTKQVERIMTPLRVGYHFRWGSSNGFVLLILFQDVVVLSADDILDETAVASMSV